jgi:hypothetical protein
MKWRAGSLKLSDEFEGVRFQLNGKPASLDY